MVLPCLSAFNAGAIFDNADGAGRVLTQDRAGIDPKRVSRVRSGRICPVISGSR